MNKHYFTPYFLQTVGQCLWLALLKVFCGLKVYGRENLAGLDKGFILAANHASEFDPVAVRFALPFFSKYAPLYYVSNSRDIFKDARLFGWRSLIYGGKFFELLGGYPVYKGQHDYSLALRNHVELLREKRTVCIFPEGKRTLNGEIGEAHGGVAYLSRVTDSPVVPVALTGLYGLTLLKFLSGRAKVTVHVGKPLPAGAIVPADEPTIDDYKRGAETVMARVKELREEAFESNLAHRPAVTRRASI